MTITEYADYALLDYERRLAQRELDALTAHEHPEGWEALHVLRDRATYFHLVDGEPTVQAVTERRHHEQRGTRSTRQATRYLVHGLHEYKGKFNPQMARALINAIDPAATVVLDPFCGSGTTVVEAMRMGLSGAGIDQNPLAAWISSTKCDLMSHAGKTEVVVSFDELTRLVLRAVDEAQSNGRAETPAGVSAPDDAYLRKWFPEQVLAALWAGLQVCENHSQPVADTARLCISNIVREVSWQLPEDLRVRRRPPTWTPPSVAETLQEQFRRARRALVELAATPKAGPVHAQIFLGSSRDPSLVQAAWPDQGRRLVVTSPPYATALPYIDTDRLSIVLLGLGESTQIRRMDEALTGSREWRSSEADRWAEAWRSNASSLPHEILSLLVTIDTRNQASGAGFRRRAVPALLYRYFTHMGETLDALAATMEPGEHVVMVVGRNRTGSGEKQVEIDTPELLGVLSTARGFEYSERIPFETWARYGMHSKNSVSGEDAVVMTMKHG